MTFLKKNIFASLIVLATTTATVIPSGYGMNQGDVNFLIKTEQNNGYNGLSKKLYAQFELKDESKNQLNVISNKIEGDARLAVDLANQVGIATNYTNTNAYHISANVALDDSFYEVVLATKNYHNDTIDEAITKLQDKKTN